ncbi:MAG: CheB methylesterase [Bacteroidota bacterium]|nr:CheB methylesterase [Bacteroidota bacterium]
MKIFVIGGSAGALESVKEITAHLRRSLDAAIFVVIHFPADKKSNLPEILNVNSVWLAQHAKNNTVMKAGRIYVAPPDRHMILENGKMYLTQGPKENRFRPSIDVLFRSAAVSYGALVTGIVLSGVMDDGTAGLSSIKKLGGITIVQDPSETIFTGMPLNALKQVEVDHCVPVSGIAPLINTISETKLKEKVMKKGKEEKLQWELNIAQGQGPNLENMLKYGTPTRYICPDCEGPLYKMNEEKFPRYRCLFGHAMSGESLLNGTADKVEHLLWTAYRTLDEKREMLKNIEENGELKKQHEKIHKQMSAVKQALDLNTENH